MLFAAGTGDAQGLTFQQHGFASLQQEVKDDTHTCQGFCAVKSDVVPCGVLNVVLV